MMERDGDNILFLLRIKCGYACTQLCATERLAGGASHETYMDTAVLRAPKVIGGRVLKMSVIAVKSRTLVSLFQSTLLFLLSLKQSTPALF